MTAVGCRYLDEAEEACFAAGMDPEKPSVKGFLNRLLGMPPRVQNLIFVHFSSVLDHEVKTAKEEYRYDDGVVDIRGQEVSLQCAPQKLSTDQVSGVALDHVRLEIDRGVSHERALAELEKKKVANGGALFPAEGIYESSKPLIGREKDGPNGAGLKGYALLMQRPIPAFALNPVRAPPPQPPPQPRPVTAHPRAGLYVVWVCGRCRCSRWCGRAPGWARWSR